MDFEEKFSKVLQPDIYIALRTGQHINSRAKSCELSFPSFEVAYYAQKKLQTQCTDDVKFSINWMKTPDDALQYWTRDLVPHIC